MSLISKQIKNLLGLSVNPVAKFHPNVQWSRFTLPNTPNVVRIGLSVCHVQHVKHRILRFVQILRVLIRGFVWIIPAMFFSSYIFVGLCVPHDILHSKKSLLLTGGGENEGTHFVEDITDGIFQRQQCRHCCKSGSYKAHRCLSDGKTTCLTF